MFSVFLFISYTILKLKYMVTYEEWSLTQQTVLSTSEELSVPNHLQDHQNVSIAIQFNLKKKVLTDEQKAAAEAERLANEAASKAQAAAIAEQYAYYYEYYGI